MAVKGVLKNVPLALQSFKNSLKGTEWEGLLPEVTNTNIKEFGSVMMQYQPIMNRFMNQLVNVWALQKIDKMYFTSPFAFAKRGMLEYGETIESVWVKIAAAHSFCSDTDPWAMLKQEKPDIAVAFMNRNREEFFKKTVNREMLRSAFYSAQGLGNFVDRVIDSMYTGNEVSEMLYAMGAIASALDNGFVKLVHTVDPVDADTAQDFLTTMRIVSNNLLFPSENYNAAGVLNTTARESQRVFITPKADAVTSVRALAYAFHMDEAQILGRITVIPEIPNHPEILAIVADDDWLNIYDQLFETSEFFNSEKLYWNYWLHVWQIYFTSPFHNAVALTTDQVQNYTAVTITGAESIAKGAQSKYTAATTPVNGGVIFSLEGAEATSTRIVASDSKSATIEVSPNETAKTLTLKAVVAGQTNVQTTKAVTITG